MNNMKTLFTSSLALVALGATAQATTGPAIDPAVDPALGLAPESASGSVPEKAPATLESEWARLDREIGDLAASINRPASGTNVGGLIRTYFARSNDSDSAFELDPTGTSSSVNSGNQVGGFHMKDVDLWAEGSVAEYDWRINLDYYDAAFVLEDAYVRWNCGSGINIVIGQFKAPLLHSSAIYPENQVLPDRTFMGQIFDFWDQGVMITGDWKSLGAFMSVQNGFDGAVEELLVSGRAEYRLFGGTGRVEGAFGASGDTRGTVGLMWLKDSSDLVEGNAWGGDANFTSGPVSLHAEVVNFDGDLLASKAAGGTSRISGSDHLGAVHIPINFAEVGKVDDATMWSSTLSFMIEAIDVELAVRLEGYDDPGNTRSATIGANWYRSGKNAVWHIGVTQISSNDPGNVSPALYSGNLKSEGIGDATLLQVGLSLGLSTSNI